MDVRIDALCLTAESLSAAFGEQRRRIHARDSTPATVRVRVLMPNRDIDLAFPRMISNPEEADPVHHRWLQMRNAHGTVLSDHLRGLGAAHGIDVDVEFKALPFTPPVKLYLLNGTEALFAYYRVTEREEQINRKPVAMYDALGANRPSSRSGRVPGRPTGTTRSLCSRRLGSTRSGRRSPPTSTWSDAARSRERGTY